MPTQRIFYLVPPRDEPTGGVNTIFEHVSLLDRAGFSARVLQMEAAKPYAHAPVEAPCAFLDQGVGFREGDVLVLPEGSPQFYRDMAGIQGVRRLVFCQNHFYFMHMIGRRTPLADLGLSGLFACSNESARFLGETLGAQVPVVPCAVDTGLFRPGDKRLSIAHMPRKMAQETVSIQNILSWRHPELDDVPWTPIQARSRSEVAQSLGESAIFLSTSWYEGLGLPPLEAMACGCVVVGFHGWGGLDYLSPRNGVWCEEGNLESVADALAHAVNLVREDGPGLAALRQAAVETAARYSTESMETALINFWERTLGA